MIADYSACLKRDILTVAGQTQLQCCRQSFFLGLCRGSKNRVVIKTRKPFRRLLVDYLTTFEAVGLRTKKGRVILEAVDQLSLRQKFVERLVRTRNAASVKHCQVAFLQGLFVARGYIQYPERGYHLEFRLRGKWLIAAFKRVCRDLKTRFSCYVTGRDTCFYLKSGKKIIKLLNLLGLFDKSLELSDLAATRSILSMVNRQVNFETANINRLIGAAEESINQIRELFDYHDQDIWTDSLRQLSLMRLKYPHDSLEKLGQRFEPALSKSAVNHRLRRIKALHAKVFPACPSQIKDSEPDACE
jgi:DNA-binding protein WhiA